MAEFLYLASQSPRRGQLLEQMGIPFRLLVANAEGDQGEDAEAIEAVLPGEAPSRYVRRVTDAKLDAAVARLARRAWAAGPVLCADTTVAIGRTILGKPAHHADACRMLGLLAGRSHQVLTAVALQHGPHRVAALSRSRVQFAPMTDAQIERYVASGEPFGKAGAYAVQGLAGRFIARIGGSYSGIMGLPVHETGVLLDGLGLDWPVAAAPRP